MPSPLLLFPDNTVIVNFALAGEMELFETLLRGQGTWCASVAAECDHKASEMGLPAMMTAHRILGEPMWPETQAEHLMVRTNREYFAAPGDGPMKHLGESETLAIIGSRSLRAVFITDDGRVPARASELDIRCLTTWDLLHHAYQQGMATLKQVLDMRRCLLNAGRGCPSRHRNDDAFMRFLES